MCTDNQVSLLQEGMLQARVPDEFRSIHVLVCIAASVLGTYVCAECCSPWCSNGEVTTVVEVPCVKICPCVVVISGMLVVETAT